MVMLGLSFLRVAWWVELRVYSSLVEFQVIPNANSNSLQTDLGSHKCGTVESINANMPSSSSLLLEFEEIELLVSIDDIPTRRSRDMSV